MHVIERLTRHIPYGRRFFLRDQLARHQAEVQRIRDLYLDLLIRCVSNTIYRDPTMMPDQRPDFVAETRHVGKDWPARAHSMIGVVRLQNLKEMTELVLREG